MLDRPKITELLELSRFFLRTELRSALPQDHKYTALMIANVISIALRELDRKPVGQTMEAEELSQILGHGKSSADRIIPAAEKLDSMYNELSTAIREGQFDPPGQINASLRKFLMKWTKERVKLYNPGALD